MAVGLPNHWQMSSFTSRHLSLLVTQAFGIKTFSGRKMPLLANY
jgi:hypothetical protein